MHPILEVVPACPADHFSVNYIFVSSLRGCERTSYEMKWLIRYKVYKEENRLIKLTYKQSII